MQEKRISQKAYPFLFKLNTHKMAWLDFNPIFPYNPTATLTAPIAQSVRAVDS